MIKLYWQLAKPGIIYGNLFTTAAGFFMAKKGLQFPLLLETLVGISLVMASGCVFNNIFDRDIDAKMDRTKNRPLVTQSISVIQALIYGLILGILGLGILLWFTNQLTFVAALVGVFVYLILYSPLKRHTIHSTIIGSIAGAVPPVVGYTSAANKFDLGVILIFIVLVLWQMPHFYSIAIYRLREYISANLPVLPTKVGIANTKTLIFIYIMLYNAAVFCLYLFGYLNLFLIIISLLSSLSWFVYAATGFSASNTNLWARRMFFLSLISLSAVSVSLILSAII